MLTTVELRKLKEKESGFEVWPESEFKMVWGLVKRQRLINKLLKEIYEEAGIFSFHNVEMALANLARIESKKLKGESKEIWWRRYLSIRYKGLLRPYRILGRKK